MATPTRSNSPQVLGTLGNDYISGLTSGSTLIGGNGNDTYYVLSMNDVVQEAAGAGIDTVMTWRTSYTLGSNVENLSVLGANLFAVGNEMDNVITGGAGRQTLAGLGGNDTLTGGDGNDVFVMTKGGGSDTITDFHGGDVVQVGAFGFKTFSEVASHLKQQGSDVTLRLDDNQILTFQGTSLADLDEKYFQYALDTTHLTMTFGDNFDVLSLQSNGGTWRTSFFDGSGGRTHDVNGEQQFYMDANYGNFGVDPFSVTDGILTIHGEKASSDVAAATGHDYTSGMLSSRDTFSQTYGYFEIRAEVPAQTGTWPAFWLLPATGSWPPELDVFEQIGKDASKIYQTVHSNSTGQHTETGVSSWAGETTGGMHTYGLLWTESELVWYVDGQEMFRTATPADLHQPMYMVTNLAIGGTWPGSPESDFVSAQYNIDYIHAYQLPEHLVNKNIVSGDKWSITLDKVADGLVLKGSLDINGYGNALDNTLVGNIGNNILDGGLGADTMAGGLGSDTYIVDNVGDLVIEKIGEGTDTVRASISYTLSANLENLTLVGTANINATGNGLDNVLTGNNGNNILNGGAGADTMAGGLGDDTYYVDNVGDVITEWSNSGTDTVISSISHALGNQIENLTMTGTANINATGNWMNNVILGNAGDNIISAGSGNDTVTGGLGMDIMTGGGGMDTFVFHSAAETRVGTPDRITDFAPDDRIDLSYFMESPMHFIGESAFTAHAGEVQISAVATGGVMLNIDTTGDGAADSQIFLETTKMANFYADGSNLIL